MNIDIKWLIGIASGVVLLAWHFLSKYRARLKGREEGVNEILRKKYEADLQEIRSLSTKREEIKRRGIEASELLRNLTWTDIEAIEEKIGSRKLEDVLNYLRKNPL